jgi:hypothetical protein
MDCAQSSGSVKNCVGLRSAAPSPDQEEDACGHDAAASEGEGEEWKDAAASECSDETGGVHGAEGTPHEAEADRSGCGRGTTEEEEGEEEEGAGVIRCEREGKFVEDEG